MRALASVTRGNRADYVTSAMHHLLGREKGSQRSAEAGILALAPAARLQLRHSAGLPPASTFMPWLPFL